MFCDWRGGANGCSAKYTHWNIWLKHGCRGKPVMKSGVIGIAGFSGGSLTETEEREAYTYQFCRKNNSSTARAVYINSLQVADLHLYMLQKQGCNS